VIRDVAAAIGPDHVNLAGGARGIVPQPILGAAAAAEGEGVRVFEKQKGRRCVAAGDGAGQALLKLPRLSVRHPSDMDDATESEEGSCHRRLAADYSGGLQV
jgi:hypothetical protein